MVGDQTPTGFARLYEAPSGRCNWPKRSRGLSVEGANRWTEASTRESCVFLIAVFIVAPYKEAAEAKQESIDEFSSYVDQLLLSVEATQRERRGAGEDETDRDPVRKAARAGPCRCTGPRRLFIDGVSIVVNNGG